MTIDRESIATFATQLVDEMGILKRDENYRAWELYKDIVASSGIHKNYEGATEQQNYLKQIAAFALSAAECFNEAYEDHESR